MFFPNLVAFTSESETCKMKRCMQGDIEIHDVIYENIDLFKILSILKIMLFPYYMDTRFFNLLVSNKHQHIIF